jgi:NAD(P)H-hydrate epimerase
VVALAGPGNNGGDALVAARRLAARGAHLEVGLSREPGEQRGMAAEQLRALRGLAMPIHGPMGRAELRRALAGADLVLDGLLGFSSSGPPRGDVAALIELAVEARHPILAIDLPSGMDPGDGTLHLPHIAARWTAILTYPKSGHLKVADASALGEVWALDVGVPEQAFADLGLSVMPLFHRRSMRRLKLGSLASP